MTVKEIDFKLIKGKAESKVFKFTNFDGTIYNMVDSTAKCLLYLTLTPIEIVCNVDEINGKITVPFTITHSAINGTFEYIIEETKVSTEVIPLVKGNITVLDYVPFSETIQAYLNAELPANIVLSEDYRNQRIFFWRKILQSAFNIADQDLNIEEKWPILVNALLAKLVVYDALILAAKGNLIGFFGGSFTSSESTGQGGVKSIETGPTRVEYFPVGDTIETMFKRNAQGVSALDTFKEDICGLSEFLQVKLPMCAERNMIITPKYFQNPDWVYPTLSDSTSEFEPSQG